MRMSDKDLSLAPVATVDVEKELLRQQEALQAVRHLRGPGLGLRRISSAAAPPGRGMGNGEDDDENDDDDYDFEFDLEDHQAMSAHATSRYKTDFIELGVLGRGGGGEVVKVRNRLDRRIYAVKKIILEAEQGRHAELGVKMNQKLRREVTTISRMTHKNIVRYYQAWVEGQVRPKQEKSLVEQLDEEDEVELKGQSGGSAQAPEDESSDSENGGFWTKPPSAATTTFDNEEDGTFNVDAGLSSTHRDGTGPSPNSRHSTSIVNLLELENDHGLRSPLLTGLGFQNQAYDGLFEKSNPMPATSSQIESDSDVVWDESSVKVGSNTDRAILYIQMEYCATTLRKYWTSGLGQRNRGFICSFS